MEVGGASPHQSALLLPPSLLLEFVMLLHHLSLPIFQELIFLFKMKREISLDMLLN
jgi:hypothetical protein